MKLSHSAMNCHYFFKQYTKISFQTFSGFTEIIKKYLSINSFLLLYISFTPLTITSTISYILHIEINKGTFSHQSKHEKMEKY